MTSPDFTTGVSLRAIVVDREILFTVGDGMSFTMGLLNIDGGSEPRLCLNVPPEDYWDTLAAEGYLFLRERRGGLTAHWPDTFNMAISGEEEEDNFSNRIFVETEVDFKDRSDALEEWSCMFFEPLTASVVASTLRDRLTLLHRRIRSSSYTFGFHGGGIKPFNAPQHEDAFAALVSKAVDGPIMAVSK